MANARPTTAEELLRMPDDGYRCELVRGEVRRMSPAGFRHGAVAMQLALALGRHVVDKGLGKVLAAETGFVLRAPDVAFVAAERLDGLESPAAFFPGAPDLAAEVVSPQDRFTEVMEKIRDWLRAGCRLVFVIEPEGRTVAVYDDLAHGALLAETDELDGRQVLPGFRMPVRELFV
jgi:Uma2 family endonuclease